MKRADDVVACGVADDVDDVGSTQGSVGEVGCVDSEGGGGKDDHSVPPPSPPAIPGKGSGSSAQDVLCRATSSQLINQSFIYSIIN